MRTSAVQSACSVKDEAIVVNEIPQSREFSINQANQMEQQANQTNVNLTNKNMQIVIET